MDKKMIDQIAEQQVKEMAELLGGIEPGDPREHYLAGVVAGMQYANAAAAPAKAEAKGESRTA